MWRYYYLRRKKDQWCLHFQIDTNECETNNGGCDINANCINIQGSFNCTCNIGYSGNGFDCNGMRSFLYPRKKKWKKNIKTKIDINECLINNGGCSTNANCINTLGSFNCECNFGYSGDGITCNGQKFPFPSYKIKWTNKINE